MELVLAVYRRTDGFPKHETYGLSGQMQRAAVSVPSNIAEGKGRDSRKELIQFLFRARGSLLELQTQVMIAFDLGYLERDERDELQRRCDEVGRMLNGLIGRFREYVGAERTSALRS
jgi:four helix bundle protein